MYYPLGEHQTLSNLRGSFTFLYEQNKTSYYWTSHHFHTIQFYNHSEYAAWQISPQQLTNLIYNTPNATVPTPVKLLS